MKISAVIIDDEQDARDTLSGLMATYAPDVELLGQAENVNEGLELIIKTQPDIVFLDVEMPGSTGFDLLQAFKHPTFEVIFTTAHSNYALQAIKLSAIDFLLKPIDSSELVEAVNKAADVINKEQLNKKLETFIANISNKEAQELKIVIPSAKGFKVSVLKDVLYLQADRNYTHIYFTDGSQELASKSLKEFDDMMSDKGFFRAHQSFLINMNHVIGFTKGKNSSVKLLHDVEIELARSKKAEFLDRFGS
ncbi:MAG: response regulator transcription factor [Flavobacteriales bacterium]|nr:response regulator transcription factor [Flavobacteriales bacterium]